MPELLTIGEFSRMTHVSVKALRHYHELGLLEPANVDPATGYRFYATAQVPVAQVIRRFRDLDMPLEQVMAVLQASDVTARDDAIVSHLQQMESKLEQTQAAIAGLHALLDGTRPSIPVEYRAIESDPSIAVRGRVGWDEGETWLADAFAELAAALGAGPNRRAGVDAALYDREFFESHVGEIIAFVPVEAASATAGRIEVFDPPPGRFAIAVHQGPFADLDRTYGALGAFVVEHALGAEGAIRENYLVTEEHTDDPSELRTEVCWPVNAWRLPASP